MPKLIVKLNEQPHLSEVSLQEDGKDPVKLTRVMRVIITADSENPPTAELHMFALNWEGEVLVNEATAEAIVLHERERALHFIDAKEAAQIIELREELRNDWEDEGEQPGLVALDKIVDELKKREEIPF